LLNAAKKVSGDFYSKHRWREASIFLLTQAIMHIDFPSTVAHDCLAEKFCRTTVDFAMMEHALQ
jgi:hypothetical protein